MSVALLPAMTETLTTAEQWAQVGGMLAAAGFAGLLVHSLLRRDAERSVSFIFALATTLAWVSAEIWWGWQDARTEFVEAIRNVGWLWFMARIAGQREPGNRLSAVGWIYIGLFVVNLLVGIVGWLGAGTQGPWSAAVLALPPAKMLFVAGALVLVHNLYDSARVNERRALSLPIATMAAMWAYDLNLYAIAYLSREPAYLLETVRPAAAQVLVLMLGMAAFRPGVQAVRLSRPVAFRSLALAGVAAWLLLLAGTATVAGMMGSDFSWRAQVAVLALGVAGSSLLFLSPRARATMRVWIAKHFFEHRYDYRSEWLRFTSTLNRPEQGEAALEARIVKAIGDIVEASGGALLAQDSEDRLTLAGGLPGALADLPIDADASDFADWMGGSARIVQFDEVRAGRAPAEEIAVVPTWLLDQQALWVAVPLVHQEAVRGIVLLTRPLVGRALDWEDFDLLRVAGRQAASYLAEARGSEALLESRRFEEFHRRFAFVMHDVKNLASQMALLARNIEKHGDNPDFREDMTATVKLSADRLQSLTARLSEQDRVRVQRVAPVDLAAVARRVVAAKGAVHPVTLTRSAAMATLADADLCERLLMHLVQNAIDASPVGAAVTLTLERAGGQVQLHVADSGCGMSAEFVRTSLFRPFVSTKDGGFGIGAFQARQFAEAMGGSLQVVSREGEGSCFTLSLPVADAARLGEAA